MFVFCVCVCLCFKKEENDGSRGKCDFIWYTCSQVFKKSIFYIITLYIGLLRWHSGKKICQPMRETQEAHVQPLIWEDPLKKEKATRSSFLAWITPWTDETGRL